MHSLLKRMCWRVISKKDQTVIWAKSLSNSCYSKREPGTRPFLCNSDDNPDKTWNFSRSTCITPYSSKMHKVRGSGLLPWPQRLTILPARLEEIGISHEEFQEDTSIWHLRVSEYWNLMGSVVQHNTFRNTMDMNSNLGGFAAALIDKDIWVVNVAPVSASSKLKIIYDRGLIGTVHDWCESFSTYPRTYDLLHAWMVFSEILERGCSAGDLLIEMDRILRPEGFVMIRDRPPIIKYLRESLTALHWDGWSREVDPRIDSLSRSEEKVCDCQKETDVNEIYSYL